MPRKLSLGLAAALILLAVFALFGGLAPGHPYTYDEADYIWAGQLGFAANYLDQHALSFPTFVQKGLELMRNPGKRASFSEYIRSTGDINMYRHFHGPLYAYWLAFGQALGFSDPAQFRGSGIFLHLATTLASMLIFWWLFPSLPSWGGLLAGLLTGFNRSALVTSSLISQHLAFILVSLFTLAAAARFLRDLNPRWFYAMMALLAVSYATVESAAFLTLGLALSLFLARRELITRFNGFHGLLKLGARGLLAWTLTLLLVWPMGLLNLNFLKGYLAMGYIAVARKTFSPISFTEMWIAKFTASPWEFGAFLVALPLLWLSRRRLPRESSPFLCYALIFLLITIKMSVPYTHYLGSFTLTCAIVLALAAAALPLPRLASAALFALLAVSLVPTVIAYRSELKTIAQDYSHLEETLSFFAKPETLATAHWFVPYELVTLLHLHHPDHRFTAYDTDWPADRLLQELTQARSAPGLIADHPTYLQMNTQLRPGRLSTPIPVARATRYFPRPVAASTLRSPQ